MEKQIVLLDWRLVFVARQDSIMSRLPARFGTLRCEKQSFEKLN